jgi:tRNA U34 5-methylaminomethyl-2-thiouridine-forming methyltransferase MnmC
VHFYIRHEMTDVRIIETADGSHSLYHEQLRETYHSTHGARQESEHVFIRNGLNAATEVGGRHCILEVGFGTGLNAWLTAIEAEKRNLQIAYAALEPTPLHEDIYKELNFHGGDPAQQALLLALHSAEWQTTVKINSRMQITKSQEKVQDFITDEKFNLIYYDAFGPPAQPDMWTTQIFSSLYNMMSSGGILVTYCAKGQVRRDLQQTGFAVERLAGPPGKREMLRAFKK